MRRFATLAGLALLVALPACRQQSAPAEAPRQAPSSTPDVASPAPAPEAESAPSQPVAEQPAPAPATITLEPMPDPWKDYVYVGPAKVNAYGPPTPPVGRDEEVSLEDLASGWTAVPVVRPEGAPAPDVSTPEAANLAIDSVNNRGLYIFEILALERDESYFVEKLMPDVADYMEFLKNLGRTISVQDAQTLEAHLRKEARERIELYGSYVAPLKREDRLGVIVDNRVTRLTRWTFEYKDRLGETREDCLYMLLLQKGWCMLDFGCDQEPWELPYQPVPQTEPASSVRDGDVVSQPDTAGGA